MSTLTQRLAAAPRVPWRLGVAVALLVVAAVITAIVAGAIFAPRPAPYGPAVNGQILFVDSAGAIVSGDPITGTTVTLVGSPGGFDPIYSQDGSRFAFYRFTANGPALFVGDARGGEPVLVSTTPFSEPSYIGWSARGDRLLVVDVVGRMLLFGTTKAGPAAVLNDLAAVGPASIGPGYNYRSSYAFRPPFGEEIVFVEQASQSLMAAAPDGTGLRVLIDKKTSGVRYTRLMGADWSPDGSRLLVMVELLGAPDRWRLFILDADGSGLRRLLGENPLDEFNAPKWSPDGTLIGFQWWTGLPGDGGQEYHGIGVLNLASGEVRDLGPVQPNGFTTWEFSPDGKSILELPGDGSNQMHIVDIETGTLTTTPWKAVYPITWQRVAK